MVVDKKVVPQNDEPKTPVTAEDYFGYAPELFDGSVAQEDGVTAPAAPENLQDQINTVLKDIKVDDAGKFTYPDGISPELKAAVAATKSFRDTQSSYTKSQQENKVKDAELVALKEKLAEYETPESGLSQADQKILAEMKFTNPDQWYVEMKKLETASATRVEEKFADVQEKARNKTVQEIRVDTLEDFNTKTDKPLTTDQLDNDVPPRWKQEVEAGTLSFEDFLVRSADFLYSNKTVANPTIDNPTNINKVTGGTKDPMPADKGINYADVTF